MTTGRINQVTIFYYPRVAWRPKASELLLSRRFAPQRVTPRSKATQGSHAIQLPPLSSPQGGPPHYRSDARHRSSVWHAPRRRRIPFTGHIRRRLPALAYPRVSLELS